MGNFDIRLRHSSFNYNVSGSQRFKYFCPATSLSSHGPLSCIILSPPSQQQQQAQQKSQQRGSKTKQQSQNEEKQTTQNNNNNETIPSKKEYKEDGTQTENFMDHLTETEKKRVKEMIQEREIQKRVELEREKRKRERKAQEDALPPLKDAKAIRSYRRFLEENERKDFQLREKEIDDDIERKLQKIEQNLKERFGNTNNNSKIATDDDKKEGTKKKLGGIGMISSIVSKEDEPLSTSSRLPKLRVTSDGEGKENHENQASNVNSMSALFNGPIQRYNRVHARQVANNNTSETSSRKKQHQVKSLDIVQSSFANLNPIK